MIMEDRLLVDVNHHITTTTGAGDNTRLSFRVDVVPPERQAAHLCGDNLFAAEGSAAHLDRPAF